MEKRIELFKQIAKERIFNIIPVFEDIYDPHNVMAAVRTCEALGIQQVYICLKEKDHFDPNFKGKSSSSGINKWIDFKTFENIEDCFKDLKENEFKIAATHVNKTSQDFNEFIQEKYDKEFIKKDKLAVVFGNESVGISDYVKKNADFLIYKKMYGFVESFNLSVSCALIMDQIVEKYRKNRGVINTQKETLNILEDWSKKTWRFVPDEIKENNKNKEN